MSYLVYCHTLSNLILELALARVPVEFRPNDETAIALASALIEMLMRESRKRQI